MNIEKLVEDFTKWNLEGIELYRDLISTKDSKGIFPPYIPFVGKSYDQFRIFVYAKAQNVAYNDGYLMKATAEERVKRIFAATSYRNVNIAPCKSGVIPALVGIYLYAKLHIRLEDFEEIQNYFAVTNYYKFSLNGNGKDINPDNLGKFRDPHKYKELNDELCKQELEFLKPKTVLSFKGWHNGFLYNTKHDYDLIEIADPAFILRGGWGRFHKGGSYYEAASNVKDQTAIELAKAYSEKCEGDYMEKNKIDSVRIYLLKYYRDWQAQ